MSYEQIRYESERAFKRQFPAVGCRDLTMHFSQSGCSSVAGIRFWRRSLASQCSAFARCAPASSFSATRSTLPVALIGIWSRTTISSGAL